ncbi:Dipeptide transport system permease protein DppC (TC 3.A.1.5.2) [Klebsiella pneumoniae IS39]|nr:Dipeptide transport system permease protein DppC (TC 3.A.1.5.2) [Klebsiella pneumoniae IS39]
MRLLNWRRQAALNAMPGIRPGEIHTPWHEFWRRFRRQPVAMGAGIFVLLLIAVAIVAPWIAPYDAENYFDYDRLNEGPSLVHWFGVDSLGRDIFSRVLVGAQISLAAGVLAVLIGAAIGTVLGLLAGYYEAGGTGSLCDFATCCSPFRGSCWRSRWSPSWAAGWPT